MIEKKTVDEALSALRGIVLAVQARESHKCRMSLAAATKTDNQQVQAIMDHALLELRMMVIRNLAMQSVIEDHGRRGELEIRIAQIVGMIEAGRNNGGGKRN